MDWKREAVDKLRCYAARRTALAAIPEEIRRLEAEADGLRATAAARVAVQGGGGEREDRLLTNIAHREELERALEQTRAWVALVERGLAVLDPDERMVLHTMYMRRAKGGVERLCEELHVEVATVYRRRDEALRRFTLALYGTVET